MNTVDAVDAVVSFDAMDTVDTVVSVSIYKGCRKAPIASIVSIGAFTFFLNTEKR